MSGALIMVFVLVVGFPIVFMATGAVVAMILNRTEGTGSVGILMVHLAEQVTTAHRRRLGP